MQGEALAGTRHRDRDEATDEQLGRELLTSEKDRREHQHVVDGVSNQLGPLCKKLTGGDDVTLVKLARVQHLRASFEGHLKPSVTDFELITALHPTPAVGGVPSDEAVARIAAIEPFDRGLYAGPVGYFGKDETEFAVGIRSMLIAGDLIRMYSGAGIVAGSNPEEEWQELDNKIAGWRRILVDA